MTYTVYKHTCRVTGKAYVGYTKLTMEQRFVNHCSFAKKGSTFLFHKAITKYGVSCWDSEVLEVCATVAKARELEKAHIITHGTFGRDKGYNMTQGGEGNACVGRKLSQEHKAKVVAALRNYMFTPEQYKARGLKQRGEKRSLKARAAISAGIKKAKSLGLTEAQLNQLKAMHEANKGAARSEETKLKIAMALKGKPRKGKLTDYQRKEIRTTKTAAKELALKFGVAVTTVNRVRKAAY